MRAVRIDSFKPSLDNIASRNWGGDCQSERTTRKGIRYFSCAGHGGYLVDSSVLSDHERSLLDMYATKLPLKIAVQHRKDGDYVFGVDYGSICDSYTLRRKSYPYNPYIGDVEWLEYPIYEGEEDEMWAVIEKVTGVRVAGISSPEHDRVMDEYYMNVVGRK